MRWHAIADDLSGAAEVAGALLNFAPPRAPLDAAQNAQKARHPSLHGRAVLELAPSLPLTNAAMLHTDSGAALTVIDSDNRSRTAREAFDRLSILLADIDVATPLFLKFDSLLRGNIGAELTAVRAQRPVVFCPAVPHNGRTVVDGVMLVNGQPLHLTELWAAEGRTPATTIGGQLGAVSSVPDWELVGDTQFVTLTLAQVRSTELEQLLRDAADLGAIIISDAETSADLERIAVASLRLGFALAGAAGLAAAVAPFVATTPEPTRAPGGSDTLPDPSSADTVFVLGTASTALQAQLTALSAVGVPVLRLTLTQLADATLPAGTIAVVVTAPVEPHLSATIVRGLAALAARDSDGRHLVLSGGETARAVLDELNITQLRPLAQAHPGAVVSVSGTGRLIATRPGSYGAPDSLVEILATVRTLQPHHL
ncbi:MAG TPA: four-carbon acid sugar kinase family protein [Glaciihabitans sp.]|jgi:4-hydroxythreonine-4-phosphate dehydrogenase|nr:four-carbon acid sugar kinase family protein [Glaciihabitans sp.]